MAYKLIIKTLAEKDILEAADYYHNEAPHLTSRFIVAINNTISLLLKNLSTSRKNTKKCG